VLTRERPFSEIRSRLSAPSPSASGASGSRRCSLLARGRWPSGARSVSGAIGSPAGNVGLIGRSIFTTYLLAFEVTSALLVVAVVGAVVLARRPRQPVGENGASTGPVAEPDDALYGPEATEADDAEEGTVDTGTAGGEPGLASQAATSPIRRSPGHERPAFLVPDTMGPYCHHRRGRAAHSPKRARDVSCASS